MWKIYVAFVECRRHDDTAAWTNLIAVQARAVSKKNCRHVPRGVGGCKTCENGYIVTLGKKIGGSSEHGLIWVGKIALHTTILILYLSEYYNYLFANTLSSLNQFFGMLSFCG